MADDNGLAAGWYTSESGQRRYWTGDTWLVPDTAASPTVPPDPPSAREPIPTPKRQRAPMSPRRRRLTLAGLIALVVILIGGGVGLGVQASADQHAAAVHAQQVKKHRADIAAQKAAEAQAAADAKDAADQAERDNRAGLIKDLEASVKKTATKDVSDGLLDGPILDVSCTPLGGGSTDDLTQKTATLQCFAADKKNSDGTENGYNFSATINWDTAEYTWRLGS